MVIRYIIALSACMVSWTYPMNPMPEQTMSIISNHTLPRDVWGIIASYLPGNNKFLNILMRYIDLPDKVYDTSIHKLIAKLKHHPQGPYLLIETYFRTTHKDTLDPANLHKKITVAFDHFMQPFIEETITAYKTIVRKAHSYQFADTLKSDMQKLIKFSDARFTRFTDSGIRLKCKGECTHVNCPQITLKEFATSTRQSEINDFLSSLHKMLRVLQSSKTEAAALQPEKGFSKAYFVHVAERIGDNTSIVMTVLFIGIIMKITHTYCTNFSSIDSIFHKFLMLCLCSAEDGPTTASLFVLFVTSATCCIAYLIGKAMWKETVGNPLRQQQPSIHLMDITEECEKTLQDLQAIENKLKQYYKPT